MDFNTYIVIKLFIGGFAILGAIVYYKMNK